MKRVIFFSVVTMFLVPSSICLWAGAAYQEQAWNEAEQLFHEAGQLESGSLAAVARYADTALKFESMAKAHYRPGLAWYNAGNAWFEAGELGSAIGAYLHARIYRPFDGKVHQSLKLSRALRVDRIPGDDWSRMKQWPLRWVKTLFVCLFLLLVSAVLVHIRYRESWSLTGVTLLAVLQFGCLCFLVYTAWQQGKQGVLVAEVVQARKGPGYNYQPAFNQELSNGMEFDLIETRGDWCRISLRDGRECWIPQRQTVRIDTGR